MAVLAHQSAAALLTLAELGWQTVLLPLGAVLILMSILFSSRKRRQNAAHRASLTPHEQMERVRQHQGVRGDLERLMVEVEQMAKRMSSQLDAKAVRLEKLIEEADAKLEALEKHAGTQADHTRVPHQRPPRQPLGSDYAGLAATNPDRPARAALARATRSHAPSSNPAADPPGEPADTEDARGLDDPLARSVYGLSDSGMDAVQIARQLDEHVGKVELILALREA